MNQEDKAVMFRALEYNAASNGQQVRDHALGGILMRIHDELELIRKALTEGTMQKETPRPGRQPATTKG